MTFEYIISEYGLLLAFILLGVAALAAIILPLISALNNPKSLLKTLGGVAALAVVFLIAYSFSSSEVTEFGAVTATAGQTKFVGGALTTMYILMIVAVVAIVITEVKKAIR